MMIRMAMSIMSRMKSSKSLVASSIYPTLPMPRMFSFKLYAVLNLRDFQLESIHHLDVS